ncbi:MAG: hypothetical protein Q8R35_01060 [bacterium]|nr:hypothetical protein [bacterium]
MFHLKPSIHDRHGITLFEIWFGGIFMGAIYPTDQGIKVISKRLAGRPEAAIQISRSHILPEIFINILPTAPGGFPPNWIGELPPKKTEAALRQWYALALEERRWTEAQIEEFMRWRLEYEDRYHEQVPSGQCFHRACGGGAMVERPGDGVYCAQCGKLPDFFPPPLVFE